MNYAISDAAGGGRGELFGVEAWQWMLAVESVPALLYLVMTFTIPESPRHLVRCGRENAARKIIGELEGGDDDAVRSRIEEIRTSLGAERARVGVRALFAKSTGVSALVWSESRSRPFSSSSAST